MLIKITIINTSMDMVIFHINGDVQPGLIA